MGYFLAKFCKTVFSNNRSTNNLPPMKKAIFLRLFISVFAAVTFACCSPAKNLPVSSKHIQRTQSTASMPKKTVTTTTSTSYSCGRCHKSLSGPSASCPHCGVRFSGTKTTYRTVHRPSYCPPQRIYPTRNRPAYRRF